MTKKELTNKCREIRDKYISGGYLTDEEVNFLVSEVFKYHSEFKEKIGCGINKIYVDKADHGTYCFYINRKDNTNVKISFVHCIKNKSI